MAKQFSEEQAIIVGLITRENRREEIEDQLAELTELARTAGARVEKIFLQSRPTPDPATYIGKGKVEEIHQWLELHPVHLALFNDQLTPTQARNLENTLKVKIVDRTQLILQIFAQHARTRQARLQVELAQLEYMLPRLTRMWTHLSKQYGGIGTKGPGEKQIEADRRMLRSRITTLKKKLLQIAEQRLQQRKSRSKFLRFALVGYTNAGKSTLANTLTAEKLYTADQLFATLDTTTRAIRLPSGRPAVLSDTVGFIRNLPPSLLSSFHSTLAEILEADVLIHVVDISHPNYEQHIATVEETLQLLGAQQKPVITVFNKLDALEDRQILLYALKKYPNSIAISAKRSINISALLTLMEETATEGNEILSLLIPYQNATVVSELYQNATILYREDRENGIYLELKASPSISPSILQYQQNSQLAV